MLQTKFKNLNEQRTITPKVWCRELWFLCTALLLNDIYLPIKFQVSSLNTFWVMLQTKFKNSNEQRTITPKVWCQELWFLCTALLLNEIYLSIKFHVDVLHSFKVLLRTKKRQTDGRMEGRTGGIITICHPSGRAVVSSTASTAMAAPLFGPIMIFKITHFEFSFPLFFIFSVFIFFLLSNRNKK